MASKKATTSKTTTTSDDAVVPTGPTPYKGKKRACGYFRCCDKTCNKKWFSANTWADTWQKCVKCKKETYPYIQFQAEKGAKPPPKIGKHEKKECGKCTKIRKCCATVEQKKKTIRL